ncbi:MAG: hypothetical protein CME70_05205 [Halobacteriovorax sp.]|nr:hypothetical protein [Halobacteriovorax sp.]|tara:strand:- start:16944 stop:17318 length:375 start_codon:yes stop_codon:yes gene_type:complete
MKYTKIENNFEDDRGIIRDILSHEPIDAVTIITSKEGAVRANHYHKETYQWTYVMKGKINYVSQFKDEEVKTTVLNEGDLVVSEPFESHALQAVVDSELMILTRGPRGGKEYESDTFRLDKPLI